VRRGLGHDFWLEVEDAEVARQLGPACQWEGERREGTGLGGLIGPWATSAAGLKRCPGAFSSFFLLLFFFFFCFLFLFDLFIIFDFDIQMISNQLLKFSKNSKYHFKSIKNQFPRPE
jgi:hypothetical protein